VVKPVNGEEEAVVRPKVGIINELFVKIYNDILTVEQGALQRGEFRDLSITEMHTIEQIGMYTPRTMTNVAEDLHFTVGTLTMAINRLVKKGYVERKRIETDRRVVLVQLTEKGKLAYRIHEKFHTDMVRYLITDLEEQEEDVLIHALEKLSHFMEAMWEKIDGKREETEQ